MIGKPLIQTATGKCTVYTTFAILGRVRTQHGARWRTRAHALAHGGARLRTSARGCARVRTVAHGCAKLCQPEICALWELVRNCCDPQTSMLDPMFLWGESVGYGSII